MNDITKTPTFQEKLNDRIRDSFGDLLTDEDLKPLVEKAIQQAFFDPVPKRNPNGWGPTEYSEAPFVAEVRKAAEKKVAEFAQAAVDKWVAENPEAFKQAVDAALAKGIYGLVQQHFESMTRMPMQMLQNNLHALAGHVMGPNGQMIPGYVGMPR
jgi:hypothetical protein